VLECSHLRLESLSKATLTPSLHRWEYFQAFQYRFSTGKDREWPMLIF